MKKIVISTLPMKEINPVVYKVSEKYFKERKEAIYFPVNSAVGFNIKENDEVKIILINTLGGDNKGCKNADIFYDEFKRFSACDVSLVKTVIDIPFDAKIIEFKKLFLQLSKEVDEGCEVYLDMTFGPKPLVVLLFSFLRFVEKHLDCTIKNIVYGKVEHKNNAVDTDENKSCIYDYSSLYMLNSFINIVDSDSSEEALDTLQTFITDFEGDNE